MAQAQSEIRYFDSPHRGCQEEKVLPFQEERYQVH